MTSDKIYRDLTKDFADLEPLPDPNADVNLDYYPPFSPADAMTGEKQGIFFNICGGLIFCGEIIKCQSFPLPCFFYTNELYPKAAASALKQYILMKTPEPETKEEYLELLEGMRKANGFRLFSDTFQSVQGKKPERYTVLRYGPAMRPIPALRKDITEDMLHFIGGLENPVARTAQGGGDYIVEELAAYFRGLVKGQMKFDNQEEALEYDLRDMCSVIAINNDPKMTRLWQEYMVAQGLLMHAIGADPNNIPEFVEEYTDIMTNETRQKEIRKQYGFHVSDLLDRAISTYNEYMKMVEEITNGS